jgi:glycosyltransferase involved in cell wall biosynthesis
MGNSATVNASITRTRFEHIIKLVDPSLAWQNIFLFIKEHATVIDEELNEYLNYIKTVSPSQYAKLYACSLKAYLDSGMMFANHKEAGEYASSLAYESGQSPWIITLMQSLWHLRNDPRDPAAAKPIAITDQRVAVLVSVFNETRFCELAFKSIRKYADVPHYIVAVNNSTHDMKEFRRHVTEHKLIDEWIDTDETHHSKGLQKAMERVRNFRYIATLDSDAVGIKNGWLRELIESMTDSDAGIVGPMREPDKKTLIGQVIHPCCMVIDQKRIANRFQIDFRSLWPFWDVAGLLTWDCRQHTIPLAAVSHQYNGDCATCSTIINNSIKHFWYTSRIVDLDDNTVLDGHKVGDIRARLNVEFSNLCCNDIAAYSAAQPCYNTKEAPFLSVVLTAFNRHDMLGQVLDGFAEQTAPRNEFEVIVVDDGSKQPLKELVESYASRMDIRYIYQENSGLAAARNTGIQAVRGEIVLFHDDDDLPHPDLIAEHIKSHRQYPDETVAVLGHLDWHPSIKVTPLMHYIAGPGGQYFGFTKMQDGELYDQSKWWGGLISAKTSLFKSIAGPFDPTFRFGYEDVELARRLIVHKVRILYNAKAKKYILRPLIFEDFCRRCVKQGRALYHLAQKHPDFTLKRYCLDTAVEEYRQHCQRYLDKWQQWLTITEPNMEIAANVEVDRNDIVTASLHKIWSKWFRGYLIHGYLEEKAAAEAGTTMMGAPVDFAKKLAIGDELLQDTAGAIQTIARAEKPLRIMFVSSRLPRPDVGSSNVRVHNIVKILAEAGHAVEYVYFGKDASDEDYIRQWQNQIVFTQLEANATALVNHVHFNGAQRPDILWMTNLWSPSFLQMMQETAYWFRRLFPQVRLIIDTMDYHCKKYLRKYEYSKDEQDKLLAEQFAVLEERLYPFGDRVITVTDEECRSIASAIKGCECSTIPNIHQPLAKLPEFDARRNIVFIGSMRVNHNLDAVRWFVKEVFPLIRQQLPNIEFHIIGFGGDAYKDEFEVHAGVKVIGYVADAEEAVSQYRLFVCPMRYGAGMKGKLGTAAASGTPFVTTTIGAEGFDFTDGQECFIADAAAEFARKCLMLINDQILWHQFADRTRSAFIAAFSPQAVAPRLADVLNSVMTVPPRTLNVNSSVGSAQKIAVVTAVHNGEKFLAEMIESVLNQTMKEFELWLLDDCSTDSTRQIIEKYAKQDARIIPVFFDDNKGPYARRNYAIEKTQSPFIIIHDADDVMMPTKLEALCYHIEADDNLGIVGHWYYNFIDEFKNLARTDTTTYPLEIEKIKTKLLKHEASLIHGAAIIRRKLFDLVGLYDENPFSSDFVWLQKVALYWHHTGTMTIKNIPDCLMLRRIHTASQVASMPVLDPRGRRPIFNAYAAEKLDALAAQLTTFCGDRVALSALFKQCSCTHFLRDCQQRINEAAAQPLDDEMLLDLTIKAVELFNQRKFVGTITRLYHIERISADVSKQFKNFDLLKTMAFFVLGWPDRARQHLECEIENHNSDAARHFMRDYLDGDCTDDILAWCGKYHSLYGLEIIDIRDIATDVPLNAQPLVSVIMPAYNAQKYIAEAITSVLKQTYSNVEFIIVDDGSTDGTAAVITSFSDARIQMIRKANGGAASARNEGIRRARGQYIVFLDADDSILPQYIYKHILSFEQHPDAGMVYCDHKTMDEQGRSIKILRQPEYTERRHLIRDMFRCAYPVIQPRGLLRRTVFDTIGLFDESLLIGEDYDLMRRFILHNYKAVRLPKALYLRRIQPESLTRTATLSKSTAHFTAVRRWLETFSGEELFPDIDWSKILPNRRNTYLQMLIGATYRTIGKNYAQSQAHIIAAMAFDMACGALKESLKNEPANNQARILLDQCEDAKRQLAGIETAVVSAAN